MSALLRDRRSFLVLPAFDAPNATVATAAAEGALVNHQPVTKRARALPQPLVGTNTAQLSHVCCNAGGKPLILQLYAAGVLRQFLDWYFPPAQRCCADALHAVSCSSPTPILHSKQLELKRTFVVSVVNVFFRSDLRCIPQRKPYTYI